MTMDLLRRMIRKGATKFEICGVWQYLGELLFEPNPDFRQWDTHTDECQRKYGYLNEKGVKHD